MSMLYLLSRNQPVVELLRPSGVDADGPDVLVEQLVVDHFSILTLDVVVASTILHDEHE